MMCKKERVKATIIYSVMILYIVFLLFTMLFAFMSPISGYGGVRGSLRGISVIPFRSITDYLLHGSTGGAMINLLGNVVMFMPLGLYAIALRKDRRIRTNMLCVFLFSLFAEIMQYIFSRGISDVDDVLLNCLGGLLGIFLYKVLQLLLKNEARARTAVAVLSAIAILPILVTFTASVQVFFGIR